VGEYFGRVSDTLGQYGNTIMVREYCRGGGKLWSLQFVLQDFVSVWKYYGATSECLKGEGSMRII